MDTIRKMLLFFVGDTLVMLFSWAGLSLIVLGIRFHAGSQSDLVKILSIHSYIVAMFCYAFYLIFDLCGYISIQSRLSKVGYQKSATSGKESLESKLLLRLVLARTVKVIGICLTLTLIVWFTWLGKYTPGSFLAGAALGFLVFRGLSFLKHYWGATEEKEGSGLTEEIGKLTGPEETIPKATVED
jgi:hypothetical protein